MKSHNKFLSVVIPIYNEEQSIRPLYYELTGVLETTDFDYELLFIDDGSNDNSIIEIQQLLKQDPKVRSISLPRNYGKSVVYSTGFKASRGDTIITIDGDLQDVPEEILKLQEKANQGFDLVVGWKQNRLQNEPIKAIASKMYNIIKKALFGIRLNDSNSGLRLIRKNAALSLNLYGDRYRFIPELCHMHGYRVCEIPVAHRRRIHGKSKYGLSRYCTGLFDLLSVRFVSAFATKPLHFFGVIGCFPLSIGIFLEMYVLIKKYQGSTFQVHVGAMIAGAILLFMGFQFISIGLIGEMISYIKVDKKNSFHHLRISELNHNASGDQKEYGSKNNE